MTLHQALSLLLGTLSLLIGTLSLLLGTLLQDRCSFPCTKLPFSIVSKTLGVSIRKFHACESWEKGCVCMCVCVCVCVCFTRDPSERMHTHTHSMHTHTHTHSKTFFTVDLAAGCHVRNLRRVVCETDIVRPHCIKSQTYVYVTTILYY